jgi:hypothetical protein
VTDEHADVPWRPLSDFDWTKRAFERLIDHRLRFDLGTRDDVVSTRVWGPCPRCEGPIDDRQVRSAVALIGTGRGQDPTFTPGPERIPVDITCGCGRVHPGAAEGITGCGVSFRVELTRSDKAGDNQ